MSKKTMNVYFLKLIREIAGKKILITGATGLIGKTCINMINEINEKERLDIEIYALVRDKKKAVQLFDGMDIIYVESDIIELMPDQIPDIDFIIHGASVTSSKNFVENPVETIKTALIGSINVLELAKVKKIKSMVYLSSMEVYGEIKEEKLLSENDLGYIDLHSVRSSYSESKRMIENICVSYWNEYNVPVKIVRLAQTFGPGVKRNDERVFAEFARSAIENKDIILHTSGKSKRMYLYTEDAISAIFTVLLRGDNSNSYNVANPNTYCSILEMAEIVKKEIANDKIEIIIDENKEKKQYLPRICYKLNVEKINNMGWKPTVGLIEMYTNMIKGERDV